MKKIILFLAIVFAATTITFAQTEPKQKVEGKDHKAKVKPNTTIKDKAHNIIHPRHKRSHGVKAKAKVGDTKVKS